MAFSQDSVNQIRIFGGLAPVDEKGGMDAMSGKKIQQQGCGNRIRPIVKGESDRSLPGSAAVYHRQKKRQPREKGRSGAETYEEDQRQKGQIDSNQAQRKGREQQTYPGDVGGRKRWLPPFFMHGDPYLLWR